jgi:hypothetical protein
VPIFGNDLDGFSDRQSRDNRELASGHRNTTINKIRRDKGARPVMDQHDLAIGIEPL